MFDFFYTERTTSEYDKYKVGQRHGCLRKKQLNVHPNSIIVYKSANKGK